MSRPLLVGEAPGRRAKPGDRPFDGRCGSRLSDLIGRDVHECFDVVNLLDEWPGPGGSGKGDAFPAELATNAALELLKRDSHGTIVLAGARVVAAFKLSTRPLGGSISGSRVYFHVPHPSGVNRWWNDPVNAAQAGALLRLVARL